MRPLIEVGMLISVVTAVIALGLLLARLFFDNRRGALFLPAVIIPGLAFSFLVVYPLMGAVATTFAALVTIMVAFAFRFRLKDQYRIPIYFLTPAMLGMGLLFFYPLFYEFYLSFTDLNLGTFKVWAATGDIPFAGLDNFIDVFRERATGASFLAVLWQTILWAVINLVFHVGVGVFLAILLNQDKMRGVGIYRTILILPWVIPQIILVLVWRTEFNESVGLINQMIHVTNQLFSLEWNGVVYSPLTWIGFSPKEWFTDGSSLFAAACIVNIWLGIPFMMVNALGALQSIPRSYYEAARIDGVGGWQTFLHITLPLLKPVMVPVIALGFIWTFNNLTVIFLMTDGGRYEGADILVTDLYKQSFTYYRYSFAAAYSWVIFAILCILILVQLRLTRAPEPQIAKEA